MKNWSKEEDLLLINNYELEQKEILKLLKGRTISSVYHRAHKLKIKKKTKFKSVKNELKFLLSESNLAYYIIGFIFADGHFTDDGQLSISVANKDNIFLNKIGKILNSNIIKGKTTSYLRCRNKKIINKILDKFDFKKRKTYNPPDTSKWSFSEEQLFSLFIGFIDGDGHISKKDNSLSIGIHIHSNWLNFLFYFHNLIEKTWKIKIPKPKILNDGYASFRITNNIIIKEIKKIAAKNDLIFMNRKWDLINLNHVTQREQCEINRNKILNLYKNGIKQRQISKILNLSEGNISKHISFLRKNNFLEI